MARLIRKKHTRKLPDGATLAKKAGKQVARWVDRHGHKQEAELSSDGKNIIRTSPLWYARYRDADGVVRRVSTGCRDKQAAQHWLDKRLAEVDKIRSGIITALESKIAGHVATPMAGHIVDYLEYLRAKTKGGRPTSSGHLANRKKQLARLSSECGLKRLSDITRAKMIRWMNRQADKADMTPRTLNAYRAALMAFCNWAVTEERLATNPLKGLPTASESNNKTRRALSLEELKALLAAAETRPLNDALMIRRGERKGKLEAEVTAEEKARLIKLGYERRLIYMTMAYTGLRKGELASLTVEAAHLDGIMPYLHLDGKDAKSGQGAKIPLRADLAEELRDYRANRLAEYQAKTLADGRREYPIELPTDTKLFNVPRDLIKIFDRDIAAAGIAKKDSQGRVVCVHSLRHTFATMLSQAGVSPRRAQELLRHSDIRLTMNTYTHLELADTAGAVEALPSIDGNDDENRQLKTGTDDEVCGAVNGAVIGAELQSADVHASPFLTNRPRSVGEGDASKGTENRERKQPPSSSDKGCRKAGDRTRTDDVQLGKLTFYH